MKKIILFIALAFVTLSVQAQQLELAPGVGYSNLKIQRNDATGMVDVSFAVNINKNAVKSDYAMTITPVLQGSQTVSMPEFIIQGKRFNTSEERRRMSGIPTVLPAGTTVHNNGDSFNYNASVRYGDWMDGIEFAAMRVSRGCCDQTLPEYSSLAQNLSLVPPPPYEPQLVASFVMPEAEEIKVRAEEGSAYLDFEVGRSVILPNFRNNSSELQKIYNLIQELKGDQYATMTGITIKGYASPEGNFASNLTLSENRAVALKNHLRSNQGFEDRFFTARGYGEDWHRLDSLVNISNLSDKYALLEVIRNSDAPDSKDAKMMAIAGGAPYRQMLNDIYPRLRRTDYQLHYTVTPFTVEVGKEVFKTRPQNLSLNETFLIAQEYRAGSEEFNNLFETAARIFSDSDVANLNAAAAVLGRGDTAEAARLMSRIKVREGAAYNNNMGVLNFMQGDRESAMRYFERARAAGDSQAVRNIAELNKQ